MLGSLSKCSVFNHRHARSHLRAGNTALEVRDRSVGTVLFQPRSVPRVSIYPLMHAKIVFNVSVNDPRLRGRQSPCRRCAWRRFRNSSVTSFPLIMSSMTAGQSELLCCILKMTTIPSNFPSRSDSHGTAMSSR